MNITPNLMPTRRPVTPAAPRTRRGPVVNGARLAYSTVTGQAPRRTRPGVVAMAGGCPGCNGEASTSVGVMLGCAFCAGDDPYAEILAKIEGRRHPDINDPYWG